MWGDGGIHRSRRIHSARRHGRRRHEMDLSIDGGDPQGSQAPSRNGLHHETTGSVLQHLLTFFPFVRRVQNLDHRWAREEFSSVPQATIFTRC